MTEAILQKMQRLASVSGFVIGTASPVQRPPAARLCPGRLTEDHIRLQGDNSFASTCDRRAAPGWRRLEPMGSATPANTGRRRRR
jgi:hypothetical protein